MTKVRLQYTIGDEQKPVWAEDAAGAFAIDASGGLYQQEGSIFMTGGEGEGKDREAQVYDQLLSLVPVLCFDAVRSVIETGVAEITLFCADTGVKLTARAERVEVLSNVFMPTTFDKWPLLEGLVAAGESFLDLAPRVWADDPDADMLEPIRESARAARAALDAAPRI